MNKNRIIFYIIAAVSAALYLYLFYSIERHQSAMLLGSYTLLFGGYLWFVKERSNIKVNYIILLAIGFRLIPILAIPALSDDFYRFIWDGRVWLSGINPFALLPSQVLETPIYGTNGLTENLYNLLNSPTHYTVYPPIPQFINLVGAYLAKDSMIGSVLILRISIIGAEVLILLFLYKILVQKDKDPSLIILYALNPLAIIELSGNLHHEAIMIAFFLGFIYYLNQKRVWLSGLFLALSVGSKLLPLMFLPYILLKLKGSNRLKFILAFGVASTILFIPLLDQSFIIGMKESLTLYYQKFEFNAGLYYLAREIGYKIYGYNAIALIGKIFFVSSAVIIIGLSYFFYKKRLEDSNSIILLYFVFCIFSLILHPWYILLLIAFTPISNFRFTVLWSYLIFFTYLGYSTLGYTENYLIVSIEYLLLAIAFLADLKGYIRSRATLNAVP